MQAYILVRELPCPMLISTVYAACNGTFYVISNSEYRNIRNQESGIFYSK